MNWHVFHLGGWAVITCPCGVVYSVKCNIRAESPRDYADLLLSWKHVPNVTVYDYPRGVASHANHRSNNLFNPFEGRLLQPSEENIKKASENDLKVSFPWLNHRKEPADQDGHPVTGSCDHYVLSDVFHQNNSKDLRGFLEKDWPCPGACRKNKQSDSWATLFRYEEKELLPQHDETIIPHIPCKKYFAP